MELVLDDSRLTAPGVALADVTPVEFGDLVEPHLTTMARIAIRFCGRGDHDDVVQEALLRAWTKRTQFDSRRGSLRSWLLAITYDQARRRRGRSRRAWVRPAAETHHIDEDRSDLEAALGALTGRQRLAVECYYFIGLSVKETADVMRIAEGTVKSTLSDSRSRLRHLLELDNEPR